MSNNLEFIKEKYQDINFPTAFGGINRFHNELKKTFPEKKITLEEIKSALKELPLYELQIPRKEKFQRRAIKRPPGAGISFQADLAYLPNHKRMPYGLILVDQYSKYIYLEPLKKKTGPAVKSALDKIIEENNLFKINQISCDRGTEFIAIKKYFKEKNIGFFFLEGKGKAFLAENGIKRFKRVLFQVMRNGKKILWPDIYKNVLKQINSRPLKSLGGKSPEEVNSPFEDIESKNFVENKNIEKSGPIFKIGELVFLELSKNIGEKDYDLNRGPIARIKNIDKSAKPYMYELETIETKKPLSRKYYGYELKYAPGLRDMPHQIEKVLNTRRKNKRKEYQVVYEGSRYVLLLNIIYIYIYIYT